MEWLPVRSQGWASSLSVLGILLLVGSGEIQAEPADPAGPEVLSLTDAGCLETSLAAMRQLPRLVQAAKADSVNTLLDSWERSCGSLELIWRTRTLVAIWARDFREEDVGASTLQALLAWPRPTRNGEKKGMQGGSVNQPDDRILLEDLQDQRMIYDSFTAWLATGLRPNLDPRSSAHLICSHYAGSDDLIGHIRQESYADTRLQDIYKTKALAERQRNHKVWGIYMGSTENWRDDGNDFQLPLYGFRYGNQADGRWSRANLELGYRALTDLSQFQVAADDSLVDVEMTYFDITLELGWSILSTWRSSVDMGCGFGYGVHNYHLYTSSDVENDFADEPESIRGESGRAYALLGYSYHFASWGRSTLGVEVTYTLGRLTHDQAPEWFQDDWSVRIVFSRHRLNVP